MSHLDVVINHNGLEIYLIITVCVQLGNGTTTEKSAYFRPTSIVQRPYPH